MAVPDTVLRESPHPLYQQVAEIVAGRIKSGRLQPGDMTSELEFMKEFGVSRITVRQAFDQLERESRIFRVQGKGTFIADFPKLQPQSALTSFSENMHALGLEPGHVTRAVAEVTAPPEVSQQLEIAAGATVLHIDRLLLANGMPMAVMDAFLPPWVYLKARAEFTVDLLDERSLYSILEGACGIQLWKARETVECGRAGDDSERLELSSDAPVLSVRRLTTTRERQPVEYVHLRYRSDLYRYQVELFRHGSQPLTPPHQG